MTLTETEIHDVPTPTGPMRVQVRSPAAPGRYPGVLLYSEIFQITPPIQRIAALVAGHGYVVAIPEIYHDFEAPGTVLGYDAAGAARGNALKTIKALGAFDSDARAALDFLSAVPACTGALGVMGLCIGGHLAFRTALQSEVRAAACFYPTDLHTHGLGAGANDDTLARANEIKGELLVVWGRQDPHVPLAGREKIHARLEGAALRYQWLEFNAAHAFLRDEGPRYDPALAMHSYGLTLELFHRCLRSGTGA